MSGFLGQNSSRTLEVLVAVDSKPVDNDGPGTIKDRIEVMKNRLTFLRGSFSPVSTATVARKDAFRNIFRDLQDLFSFAPLRSQKFRKKLIDIFRKIIPEIFKMYPEGPSLGKLRCREPWGKKKY